MTTYVCGFMVSRPDFVPEQRGVFIKKNRPAFQNGLWNGVGGKVEAGETSYQAIVREFFEETGMQTTMNDWSLRIVATGADYRIYYFVCIKPESEWTVSTKTDEEIATWSIQRFLWYAPTLYNMKWILPLCLSPSNIQYPIAVTFNLRDEAKTPTNV